MSNLHLAPPGTLLTEDCESVAAVPIEAQILTGSARSGSGANDWNGGLIRTLLIEDSLSDAVMVQEILSDVPNSDVQIEWVDRLVTGLHRLDSGAVDLVLLDLGLPECRGLATFHTTHRSSPDVPIIVLTGLDDRELAMTAVSSGAQDYLVKGQFEGPALLRTMRHAVARHRRASEESRARLLQSQRARAAQAKLVASQRRLRFLANHDSLTGVHNRRSIEQILRRELSRRQRSGSPLSVIMIDLDHFKHINDTWGHAAGDEILRKAAARIDEIARIYDSVGRYGGEEFLIVVPDCNLEGAVALAERLREHFAELPIEYQDFAIPLTASLGVATACESSPLSLEGLVACADKALYRAKESGRNSVDVACEWPPAPC